jgi:hypothetical protein
VHGKMQFCHDDKNVKTFCWLGSSLFLAPVHMLRAINAKQHTRRLAKWTTIVAPANAIM